jgi:hypothetical protein
VLGRILDDSTVAAVMLDRFLHRSVVFNIDGDSYRMRPSRSPRRGINLFHTQALIDEIVAD